MGSRSGDRVASRRWVGRTVAAATAGAVALVAGAGPVSAAPWRGEPREVSAVTPIGAPLHQTAADSAFNGDSHLVVWQSPSLADPTNVDVFGARVSAVGVLLDPVGFAITSAPANQIEPAVAAVGDDFVVVWEDRTSGVDIRAARVTAEGRVLDGPDGFGIATANATELSPTITASDDTYLVSWREINVAGNPIRAVRLDATGAVLDATPITIRSGPGVIVDTDVATDGTDWFAVWADSLGGNEYRDIHGARVSAGGTVLDPAGTAISTGGHYRQSPTVAYDGMSYLVAWSDGRVSQTEPDVWARLVDGGGDPSGAEFAVSTATGRQIYPTTAHDGTNFLVTWSDRRLGSDDIFASRVDGDGTVLDPSGIAVNTFGFTDDRPAIATSGGGTFLVWQAGRQRTGFDIVLAGVTAEGSVLDATPRYVSAGTPAVHRAAAVGFDGTNHLVAWGDDLGDDSDIVLARMTRSGTGLDGPGFAMVAPGLQTAPRIAYDGTQYLVVWEDRRSATADIYAARVSTTTGRPVSTFVVSAAAGDQTQPDVAFDGTNFVVGWRDTRSGEADVYATQITPAGIVLHTGGIAVSRATGAQERPQVAAAGGQAFVVWEDGRAQGGRDVYGARVGADGSVLDTAGIPIATGPADAADPAVEFAGGRWTAAWVDDRSGTSKDIYGARISSDGVVQDPTGFVIADAAGDQDAPDIAFNGLLLLVAWQDRRSGLDADVYGAQVNASGVVVGVGGSPLADGPGDQGAPALSAGPTGGLGNYGLVYGSVSDDPLLGGVSRTLFRPSSK